MSDLKIKVDKVIEFLTCTLFVVMVIVASWQVISRFILNSPSTFTEELLRYCLIWLAMLAGAYVVGKSEHISITFLRDRLHKDAKVKLTILIQSIFLLFAAVVMVYGGAKAVSLTMAQISPALHVPMGFVYLALPLSGVFIIFYSLKNILDLINNLNKVSNNREQKKAS